MAHKLPAGASVLIPRLVCRDPKTEIDFLTGALGARELSSRTDQAGKVVHALLTFGPAMFMVEGEWPQVGSRAPQADGSSSVVLYLYVEDVDKTVEQATAAGAKLLIPTKDQFWGDRTAWVMDPAGHLWTIASRIEETSAEERNRRWDEIRSSPQS